MVIVGEDLRALILQRGLVDYQESFDETSLALTLCGEIVELRPPQGTIIDYGSTYPTEWTVKHELGPEGFVLQPRTAVLGASCERIKMPMGYVGFLQTKGSLARLFVTVHCCDAQIDPGFHGNATFELCNLGTAPVRLFARQQVAQLFVHQTSTARGEQYHGRYQHATGPTMSRSGF